jgi:multiple antibiotic resistance protein
MGAVTTPDSRGVSLAIVPLGIPLIVGPAALTAILLLGAQVGGAMTLAAFGVNIVLIYLLFSNGTRVTKHVPQAVLIAASKVVALFLAAIAVMMVRTGLVGMLNAK